MNEINNVETSNLKEEHRQNNFERLNTMFQESLEEVDRVKSEYTAKLLEATEKYKVTLQENEELEEKVEILFKLGRGYIDRTEPRQHNAQQSAAPKNDETVETEAGVNETDESEDLSAWASNKFRGFRRVSPTTTAQPSNASPAPPPGLGSNPTPPNQSAPPAPSNPVTPPINERLQRIAMDEPAPNVDMDVNGTIQYCHFFTNYGKCKFEEKTGNKCRFQQKVAREAQHVIELSVCLHTQM